MSKDTQKIDIPDHLIQVCRDMAKVARQSGLFKFSGRFTPPDLWAGDISFSWEAGRHGEDSDMINITSEFYVRTTVNGKP